MMNEKIRHSNLISSEVYNSGQVTLDLSKAGFTHLDDGF